ncbi:putative exosome-associated family protein [Erysiphe neolycopersici]|uniref:Exosome complex protein n=1 Tax=Erysiphe neolycopersici TaxID=212602 RepID=A0A420HG45_9PEZI|nr:putative exosome-associated family protein [Erysiphe neolycopersici]
MDCTKVLDLLENLDDEIDELEESMAPLLENTLSQVASKFPVLDKAKLYVLTTYAIESMIFSYLRLNGVKAHEHPVFLELTRVKNYFGKIKQAEAIPTERNMTIDKGAASRFIKAGLAGNEKFDLQRAEQQAKERARAHIRFNDLENKRQTEDSLSNEQQNSSIDKQSSESESVIESSNTEVPLQDESIEESIKDHNTKQTPISSNQNKRSKDTNENDHVKSKRRSKRRRNRE